MRTQLEAEDAFSAYEATAPYYDRLTAHHDYGLWLGSLIPALQANGLSGSRLLDLACGTGKSFSPMLECGWDVTAVDLSPAMLAEARGKGGDGVCFHVADMRSLPRLGEFDLVWCLDDAINYLLTGAEFEAALAGIARNLAPTGLGLFDVNTLAMYRGFFAETQTHEDEHGRLVTHGLASSDFAVGEIAESLLEVENPAGDVIARVLHRQRHYPAELIASSLQRVGLRCLEVFGHGYDAVLEQPLNEELHTKAVFIVESEKWR